MVEIIELLRNRIENKQFLSMNDILFIFEVFVREFEVKFFNGVYQVTDDEEKYFMGYHFDTYKVHVNLNKYLATEDFKFANFIILFSIIHELRHAKQMEYLFCNNDSLSKIYKICFDYVRSKDKVKMMYYSLYHNYFPTEINADLTAYYYMIKMCSLLGEEDFVGYYREKIYNKYDIVYDMNYYNLLEKLFGKEELESIYSEMDLYELEINGLFKEKIKNLNLLI